MLIDQAINQRVTVRERHSDSTEINRLLAAAAVSRRFCDLLLSDPARAIEEGFAGEHFVLSNDEQDFLVSLRAASLKDFATQLYDHLSRRYPSTQPASLKNRDAWPM